MSTTAPARPAHAHPSEVLDATAIAAHVTTTHPRRTDRRDATRYERPTAHGTVAVLVVRVRGGYAVQRVHTRTDGAPLLRHATVNRAQSAAHLVASWLA